MQLSDELVRLFTQLSRLGAEPQRGAELNKLEYLVLARLQRDGAMRAADLAQLEGLDQSTLSRRVAAMAERQLLEREAYADDRRASLLRPTEAGRAAFHAEQSRRVGLVTAAVRDWPADQRDELVRLLHELNNSLQNRTTS